MTDRHAGSQAGSPGSAPRDGLDIILDEFVGDDPARIAAVRRELEACHVGQAVYDLRTAAGLTQQQLAEKAGTSRSVIRRLEDADYPGESLPMLRRIGYAVGHRVSVRFEPIDDATLRRRAGRELDPRDDTPVPISETSPGPSRTGNGPKRGRTAQA